MVEEIETIDPTKGSSLPEKGPPPPEETTAAGPAAEETAAAEPATTEALNELDIQTIYKRCKQAGLSRQEGEKRLTLVDKYRKEGFDAILPELAKLEKTFPSSKQSQLKFIQGVWQELTGQAPPEDITNPNQLFINLLQNEAAVEKLAPLFPDDPTWKDKLQAIKDKKGIQIALGVLSKNKPSLYSMLLVMTLFQMYEQSQERQ